MATRSVRPAPHRLLCLALAASAPILFGLGGAQALASEPAPSRWGGGELSQDEGGTRVDVGDAPGGAMYVLELDPARSYRVSFRGTNLQGRFVLRVRRDEGSYEYRWAPAGVEVLRVTGVSTLELLLYSDEPGSYRLLGVESGACDGECPDDERLREKVLAQTPGLAERLSRGDTLAAARLIARWAAPRIPAAGAGSVPLNTSGRSAAELHYDFFQPSAAGVYCGGAADFLAKLLKLFAIDSFTVDFGQVTDGLTHVTVVLPLDGPGEATRYVMLDPTFNFQPGVHRTGRLVTVPEMLELWRAGLSGEIDWGEAGLEERKVILTDKATGVPSVVPCSLGEPASAHCNFSNYRAITDPKLDAHGFQRGSDGLLQLLGTTTIFTFVGEPDVPEEFLELVHRFKTAVLSGDDDVHVADLPIPPVSVRSPRVEGVGVVGEPLAVRPEIWHERTPPTTTIYRWSRCDRRSRCVTVKEGESATYTPRTADVGRVISVSAYGSSAFGGQRSMTSRTMPIHRRETSWVGTLGFPAPTVVAKLVFRRRGTVGVRLWNRSDRRLRVRVLLHVRGRADGRLPRSTLWIPAGRTVTDVLPVSPRLRTRLRQAGRATAIILD